MRRNWIERDLIIIVVLTLVLILIIAAFPVTALRLILGLPFLLFSPGYVLIAALFPRKGSLGGLERIALSFGLSIAVTPLIGLILNYMPWGIRLYPILIAQALFIVAIAGITWYRRKRLPQEERFSVPFLYRLPSLSWHGESRWDKLLIIFLAVSIAGATGTFIYTVAVPKDGEKFTEFYILGSNGEFDGYPTEFTLDGTGQVIRVKYDYQDGATEEDEDTGEVVLSVVNREQGRTDYRIELVIGGEPSQIELDGWHDELSFSLDDGDKWEHVIGFAPQTVGDDQKAEFLLLKADESEAAPSIHLWIDVKQG